MNYYSLRAATLTAVVVPTLFAALAVAGAAVWLADASIGELLDAQMRQEANFLLMMSRHEAAEREQFDFANIAEPADLRALLGAESVFRIWAGAGLMTESGPEGFGPDKPPDIGFSVRSIAGRDWRTVAVHDATVPLTVEVNQPMTVRNAMTARIGLSLLAPLALLVAAVCTIAYFRISAALSPMRRISADLDARGVRDISPLQGETVPREIAPLFEAFNRLLARLGEAIEREREFTDNAAHELRTPLAALKTRAQIIIRDLDGGSAHAPGVADLIAATDRASAVVDQLILLSRVQQAPPPGEIDLSALAAETARDLAPDALAKGQTIEADIAPHVVVRGHPEALRMMMGNLIANAIRYTPAGGTVSVGLGPAAAGSASFAVSDTGPGIAPDRLSEAGKRFVRLSTSEPGSGLGLSIVRRIADLHGAGVTLENRASGGLCARVAFPRPDADTARRPPPGVWLGN